VIRFVVPFSTSLRSALAVGGVVVGAGVAVGGGVGVAAGASFLLGSGDVCAATGDAVKTINEAIASGVRSLCMGVLG